MNHTETAQKSHLSRRVTPGADLLWFRPPLRGTNFGQWKVMRPSTAKRLFSPLLGAFLGLLGFAFQAHGDVVSEMRVQSDSFLSPAYDAGPQSSYQFLGARFVTERVQEQQLFVDFNGAYALGAPLLSYIDVRELAFRFEMNDHQSFTIGRKLERWSELDRRWNFGVIEPVFKWNPLSPESQGLTGAFWEVKDTNYRFMLFGSVFYLPNQGPSFEINADGEFERGNPWFHRPPSSIRILSETSKIEYNFNRPTETDVVLQTSYGAELNLGEDGPWRARAALLYKPMNELALGYDGELVIPKDRGVVTIEPKVMFHNVRSVDFAYMGSSAALGVSAMQDQPPSEKDQRAVFSNSSMTVPIYSTATMWSPWLDVRLAKGWKASLQHLSVDGGEVVEQGKLADPPHASITQRYPYTEANQVSLEFDQRLAQRRRLIMRAAYMQSEKNEFQLFRWTGRLQLGPEWSLQSEMQLVDAADPSPSNSNAISDFRNNDRILLGVGYVF